MLSFLFPAEQREAFQNFSIKDGLSQNSILCIFQDSKGFMWFGTRDGLNLYDGYTFSQYHNNPQNPDSLSDNTILTLYEDGEGLLWIGTHRGGVNRFNRQTGIFTRFTADPSDPNGLGSNTIQVITAAPPGVIWIGTWDKGLYKYNRQKEKISRWLPGPDNTGSPSPQRISSIRASRTGLLWVGTEQGLKLFDPGKETFVRHYYSDPGNPHTLGGNNVSYVIEDHVGDVWVGTYNNGLNRLDRKTNVFTRYTHDPGNPFSLSHNLVYCVHESKAGDIWVGTLLDGGLNKFDRKQNKFFSFKAAPNDPFSISQDSIRSIYQSQSRTLWVGTSNKGLNKLIQVGKEFLHYKKEANNPNSLSHNVVSKIYEDHLGILWVATMGGGLNRLDQKRENVTHFTNNPREPGSLGSNHVSCLWEDSTGRLWVGTLNGLFQFNRQKKTFSRYEPKSQPGKNKNQVLSYGFIVCLLEDHQGLLWIGTLKGLYALNLADGKINSYSTVNPDSTVPSTIPGNAGGGVSHNEIRTLYETRSGVLWIGTYQGLNRFDRENKRFIHYLVDPANPKSISQNDIFCICEDHKGTLWIGTHGGGLNKMANPGSNPAFIHYTREDGLPNNVIHGILEDNMGFLWLSTNNGLSRFAPATGTFINYTNKDGLQDNEFVIGSYYKNQNGEMFFGGINGFNAFHPEKILKNLYVPPVVITAIKVLRSFEHINDIDNVKYNNDQNNRIKKNYNQKTGSRFFKRVADREPVVLPYTENTFSIEFAALDYTDPVKNQYAYMLEGLDRDWIYLGVKRQVIFNGLPPGEYRLRVKGSNSSGIWNEKGLTRTIKILSPPWKTWSFILLIVPPVIVIAFFLIFFKIRQKKQPWRQEIDAEIFFSRFSFSNREKEIIKLLLKGKNKQEIEAELFISPHTVKNNIYNIYQKLGVKNRLQIIKLIQKK
jgi:ligand-binding sensor domain-containing protein/DNA-binding CsgD family transcriptional regulator